LASAANEGAEKDNSKSKAEGLATIGQEQNNLSRTGFKIKNVRTAVFDSLRRIESKKNLVWERSYKDVSDDY
jgi:hypothetical protein